MELTDLAQTLLDAGEPYDLNQDPTETHNLWADPGHLPAKAALLKRLCDRMAFPADPLPPRTGPW